MFFNKKIFFLIILTNCWLIKASDTGERSIVIVIASYNNKDWYKQNLDSVFMQRYENYRLIYIDDCSTDGTNELVQSYVKEKGQEHRVTLIHNSERRGAMENQYYAIHSCDDNAVIVLLDGDDWLAHDLVLSIINDTYKNPEIWLTYGQYKDVNGRLGCCRPINEVTVSGNAYRDFPNIASHLRTFYAWLFKRIENEDLLYEGKFFQMTSDWALMFSMLEMSGGRFKFITDILYIYNTTNPINDCKVNEPFQIKLGNIIQKRKRYKPLGQKPE